MDDLSRAWISPPSGTMKLWPIWCTMRKGLLFWWVFIGTNVQSKRFKYQSIHPRFLVLHQHQALQLAGGEWGAMIYLLISNSTVQYSCGELSGSHVFDPENMLQTATTTLKLRFTTGSSINPYQSFWPTFHHALPSTSLNGSVFSRTASGGAFWLISSTTFNWKLRWKPGILHTSSHTLQGFYFHVMSMYIYIYRGSSGLGGLGGLCLFTWSDATSTF